jgi:hypothetical protein
VLTKEQLNRFAEKAGFGGNQRNTYRVRLELFAKQVEAEIERQILEQIHQELLKKQAAE